jgi:hypothetical protein
MCCRLFANVKNQSTHDKIFGPGKELAVIAFYRALRLPPFAAVIVQADQGAAGFIGWRLV